MEFEIERDLLAEAVAWASRTLPARPALPVLAALRLSAENGALTVSGFDYDSSATVTVPASSMARAGSALAFGRLLAEITRSLPNRPVRLASDGTRTGISCGPARFSLPGIPAAEYPELPKMPPRAGSAGSAALATAVRQVAVASSRDDSVPALTGALIDISGPDLTLVCTDRYRLAVRTLSWHPAAGDISARLLVPARLLDDLVRPMTASAEISLALPPPSPAAGGTEGLIGLTAGDRLATVRLISTEFPEYRKLMPGEAAATAALPTAGLIEAVRRVALVAERNTALSLAFSSGELKLQAGAGEQAEATESMDAGNEGADWQVRLNPHYLLDALSALESDTARIDFTAPGKPVLITGEKSATSAPAYRHLLMPIRIND